MDGATETGNFDVAGSFEGRTRPADSWLWDYRVWVVCGLLLLAVGLVFGQTVRHEFIGFDDQGYVYENPHVTAGLTLPGLWWALTEGPLASGIR